MTSNVEVGKPCAAYVEAAPAWAMVAALKAGTLAMRGQAEAYLPRNLAELDGDYKARLARTFLFAAYARTIELMVGKVFAKPVEAGETVPAEFQEWLKDIDLEGADVHTFAARLCEAAFDEGLAHVLVDLPNTEPMPNLGAERAAGVRPYWTLIRASSVIGWRVVIENGKPILEQLRVAESAIVPSGDFGEKYVARVRVYMRDGSWQLWECDKPKPDGAGNSYQFVKGGKLSIGRIPLVTFYAKRTGHMTGSPLMEDLAWLNVEHWQKSSDQSNILHVARVPILFGKGFDATTTVKISANSMVMADNHEADLKYVEHSGAAIEAGQTDLDALVDRMAALGVDMLIKKRPTGQAADATATGKAITESGENSILGNLARSLKMALDAALAVTAEWMKRPAESAGGIDMDTQLGVPAADRADVTELVKLRVAGELSAETLFAELQRREFIDPTIKFEDEQARLAAEPPPLAMRLGAEDGQDDDDDESGTGAGNADPPAQPGFPG